jgi:AraC family transcriptional regulator
MALEIEVKPVEKLLFHGDCVAVGRFRCPSQHALYRDSGPCSYHTLAFPRSFTMIEHDDGRRFVGGPDSISLYNQHQVYYRTKLSDIDACDWYVVADDILIDAVSEHDPDASNNPRKPFRFTHARCDAQTYLLQRQLFDALERGDEVDLGWIDERVIGIVRRVLANAYDDHLSAAIDARDRERVEEVKKLIAGKVTSIVSLRELARGVESSPFRLCRIFKARTGETLTSYRHSLRLRLALERLRDRRTDITELALDLGYSSHSHFTAVFRRRFGVTPSAMRAGSYTASH